MTIADPTEVELEIWLPVDEAIALDRDADVTAFLNISPLKPFRGRLRQTGYEALPTPDGLLAYHLKASIDAHGSPPRIGLRATARITGQRVSVFTYLFRRPLGWVRRVLAY